MSRIDYGAIETAIQTVLDADPSVGGAGVKTILEDQFPFGAEATPWVGVYLENRELAGDQPIAANTVVRMRLRFSLWCVTYSLDIPSAMSARDELMGNVEIALLKVPTLNLAGVRTFLAGGDFQTGQEAGTWEAAGEVVLTCEVRGTTT